MKGDFGNNNNDAQLIFRPLNKELAPISGNYYSLATNQTTDPSLRINQWSATSSNPINYGFLYDSIFNPPPSTRTVVAGGYGLTNIIYSLDNGSTWFPSTSPFLSECTSIAFNGSMWIAGGGNTLLYSGDGVTWTASPNASAVIVDSSGNGSVLGLAANGSLWVAAATTGLFYSYDGIYWNATTTTAAYFAVAWNGSLWVATGQRVGSIPFLYSYDGITWNSPPFVSGSIFTTGLSVAWNGSEWLAGGQDTSGNTLAYSYDGIHWTAQSCVLTQVAAIGWSAGLWLIGGLSETDTLLYGDDGRTWTPVPDSKTLLNQCVAITWTGTVWLAGGQGTDTIIRSFDGLNWLSANNEALLSSGCLALTVNNVLPNAPLAPAEPPAFLMGGLNPTLAYSNDGIMWNPVQKTVNPDLSGATCQTLLWNGTLWVGGFSTTANTVAYSYDGLVWNTSHIGSTYLIGGCYALAASRTLWLAGGFNNVTSDKFMISSTDGRLWADVSSVTPLMTGGGAVTAIGYNGSIWIAGTNAGTNKVLYSYNGLTNWQASASGSAIFTNACYSVAWNGQIWVGVGGRAIGYSQDGINWTAAPRTTYTDGWNSVVYNGSLWVVGGNGGDSPIAYSYDGLYWIASPSARTIFTAACISVAWSGSLWIAGGSGTSEVSAYSYNGITWFPSSTGMDVLPYVYSVATTRMNLLDSSASPVPVLYPQAATQPGQVVYSTGLNNLYVSSIMSINDASGTVQIQGDLSASTVHTDIFYATTTIITNDLSANTIQVGTLTGSNATIEDISASTLSVWTDLLATMIHVTDMSANTISVETLYTNTFNPPTINAGDISANRISATDISAGNLDAENLYVSGITAPVITATTLNAGVILGTGSSLPIGTIGNPSAITVTDSNTAISGEVYIGDGQILGNLLLRGGTAAYPICEIYPNTNDSSGALILRGSVSSAGIALTPDQTLITSPRIINSGLLIDNGAIGNYADNPNAIVISSTTMIQSADLSGTVRIGQGTGYGQVQIQVLGTADNPIAFISPNASDISGQLNLYGNPGSLGISLTPGDTRLYNAHVVGRGLLIDNGTIGKTDVNLNAIVIGDNRTMVQNADLSGTVTIGNGDASGALKIQSDATGQATMFVNTAELGQLTLGSSATNLNAVTITDKYTIIQKADLSGTVYIGDGDVSGALQLASGATGRATIQVNTPVLGELVIGSSDANLNAITITDTATTLKNVSFLGGLLLGNGGTIGSTTSNVNAIVVTDNSGTIFQNRGDSSGTITIGNPSSGALQLTSSSSVFTIRPTVASAGRLTIGSSVANPNAIVISDTSGTIIQNRGDSSGTISIGNPSVGALQLTGSSSGTTIRPTVASAGRLSIGSSTANPNAIVVTDTSGTIIQNPDLSGTVYIGHGNRSTSLKITGGDISGGGSIQSLATLQPNVSMSGELILGSSAANPNAIVITDTDTIINNFSLGASIRVGAINSLLDASGIRIEDEGQTTIYRAYIQPYTITIPSETWTIPGSGGVYRMSSTTITPPTYTLTVTNPGRYIIYNIGFASPRTLIYLTLISSYTPPGDSPRVLTLFSSQPVDLQQSYTFDIFLGTTLSLGPAKDALVASNCVLSNILSG